MCVQGKTKNIETNLRTWRAVLTSHSPALRYCIMCFLSSNLKGSDCQCMEVERRMQYCRVIFYDSFETYQTFLRCILKQNFNVIIIIVEFLNKKEHF